MRERERERESGGETSFYRFSSIGQVRDRKIQRKKKWGCFTCGERNGYASTLSLRPLSGRIQAHVRRPSADDPVAAVVDVLSLQLLLLRRSDRYGECPSFLVRSLPAWSSSAADILRHGFVSVRAAASSTPSFPRYGMCLHCCSISCDLISSAVPVLAFVKFC